MDTSGPSEKKKPEAELIEDPIDGDEPDNKQLAIKAKDEGNLFYKKKQLDEAILKYDEVSFFRLS